MTITGMNAPKEDFFEVNTNTSVHATLLCLDHFEFMAKIDRNNSLVESRIYDKETFWRMIG